MNMYKNVELRKLPADVLCNIVNILEIDKDWQRLMVLIPKDIQSRHFQPKYKDEDICLILEHSENTRRKCAEILFEEWGSSGRVRPTLHTLKEVAIRAQMFRVADEVAKLLEELPPERPSDGPAAPITVDVTQLLYNESTNKGLTSMGTKSNEFHNGPTKQMITSDMIKFSETSIQATPNGCQPANKSKINPGAKHVNIEQEEYSMNVPNISLMISESGGFSSFAGNGTASSNTRNTVDSSTCDNPNFNSQSVPTTYQTSFPNINISLGIDSVILQDTNLEHFKYDDLRSITNDFSEKSSDGPYGLTGRIGSGGFGDVFVGNHSKYGLLAVKKAHDYILVHKKPDIAIKVFNAEVKYLSQFKHKNIVPILGFSKDGPVPCIVCEYIDGGSLQDNIARKILNEQQRISIMVGTAEGLKYLHTYDKPVSSNVDPLLGVFEESDSQNSTKNFVHGDVKSANILLTLDYVPKLCDFGLAKQYDSTFVTTSPMGTSAYMAPEGMHGTITQKVDIFSFGIVLLELLTGHGPIVKTNGEILNIKHYVEENLINNDISNILDSYISDWVKAKEIHTVSQRCLEPNRKNRPTIVEVCDSLYKIRDN